MLTQNILFVWSRNRKVKQNFLNTCWFSINSISVCYSRGQVKCASVKMQKKAQNIQIDDIVESYKTLSKIPSITGAKLNAAGNSITSTWSVRNLDKGKNTKYLYSYTLDDKLNVIAQSEFGLDVSNELLSSVSPSGVYRALIRDEQGKDAKKQYLEVWAGGRLRHSVNLTALDVHGDVYADSEFGCLEWSPDEAALLYIAEKKKPKLEPYYKRAQSNEAPKANGAGETPAVKGEEFIYRADWGEQLVGKQQSVIVMCRLETETVTVIDQGLPDTWCPGQVMFAPGGGGVVGVAWESAPSRLGLIFCTNRPSFIFHLTFDGHLSTLSRPGLSVRSPRSSNGKVYWLQRTSGGPHHACHSLVTAEIKGEPTTLIDIVPTFVQTANNKPFHGVYSQALPKNCFTNDKRVVFSTTQATDVRAYVLEMCDGSSRLIELNKPADGSLTILDVKNDLIVAAFSNMTTPGQLYVARLPPKGTDQELVWHRVSDPIEVPKTVAESKVQVLQLEHKDSQDDVKSFTAIYMGPDINEGKVPLIVWPHGGPHSGFVNAYSLEAALFASLGFASIQINYRGSTGSGQASVEFLPRRVGDTDVKDCKYATDIALSTYAIDERNVCLFGGSHGGFLVTHLSGQYPEVYSAVVSRNPVTDVAVMYGLSDIPDWCAVEAGYNFTEKGPISEEQLLAMRRCSPIAHVHKVRAPTALMLGSGDKRVPYYQGLDYYNRLRANGVEAKMYLYEDNHSLATAPVEMDNLINSAHWFVQHLNKE